jgi:hypothetical protein
VVVSEVIETNLEFRSNAFPAIGSLTFCASSYAMKDLKPSRPLPRLGAGSVPVVNEGFPLWIGCGRYQEYPEGFLCFIEPHKPFVRKLLKKIDTRERVSLQRTLDQVFAKNVEIHSRRWWTHEEFSNPGRAKPPS